MGNKAIYRTRMMIEDGGELLVIAPGIKGFGENPEVDGLIRRYGYKGTPYTMELMEMGHSRLRHGAGPYDTQLL